MIVIHTDGSVEPVNPGGVATWAFTIEWDKGSGFVKHGVIGEGEGMTNSVAEYVALVEALKWLETQGWNNEEIMVYSDSEMLVGQMLGQMKANRGDYLPYYFDAVALRDKFPFIKFQWISRNFNKEADSLTRQAYEDYMVSTGRKPKYRKYKKRRK